MYALLAVGHIDKANGWILALNSIFVAGNLSISAHTTRQWYIKNFPKAPHPRALIPFIF